jgi:hypothetical protein
VDQSKETLEHKQMVSHFLNIIIQELLLRSEHHDDSKLEEDEKSYFDKYTPKLKECTYGTSEYNQFLLELKPALDHHYANNRHHPEHFANGIEDMDLVDLLEMLCDWKSSTLRHQDGNILKSIDLNVSRFKLSTQIASILKNTVNRYMEK